MSQLRIADVARRSGFSTATLRYYEDIGLLPTAERSSNGYRTYDDVVVQRLVFIARAKQLGCSLEEIAELLIAWDGGECGPVQDRLRTLVASKLSETRAGIVELMELTRDLEGAAVALERHRPTGPCDESCGCTTVSSAVATPMPITLVDKPSASGPAIACTLDTAEMPERLAQWGLLLRRATSREPVDGGLRVELPADALGAVVELVAAEQQCCTFFTFAVTVDGRGLGLEVRAPDEARALVDALVGSPA